MKNRWFKFQPKAESKRTEVSVYGEIGGSWDGSGVEAESFATDWRAIPKDHEITLRIHSRGGSVWDGLAIYNLIKERRSQVTAHVDGVAFSAASFIAMAAGTIEMPKAARMMIHDASGIEIGNAEDMRRMADMLDQESENIAEIYADRTGKPVAEIRDMMKATTWMTGTEAKAMGFADVVTDEEPKNCTFDLSCFRRVPEDLGGTQPPPDTANQKRRVTNMETKDITNTAPKAEATNPPEVKDKAPAKPVSAQPQPDAKIVELTARVEAAEAKAKAESDRRIANQYDDLAKTRPALVENRDRFLPRCQADEAFIEDLKAWPEDHGAEPVNMGRGSAENIGNPALEAILKEPNAKKRLDLRVEAWDSLKNMGLPMFAGDKSPRMANTFSATLVTDTLRDVVVTVLQNRLAPLRAFSLEVALERVKPLGKIEIAKVTGGGTVQTNETDFEDTTNFVATVTNIEVSAAQKTVGMHITNAEMNSGHRLRTVAEMKLAEMGDAIQAVINAKLLAASFTGTGVTAAAIAFGYAELKSLWGGLKKSPIKNIILDGEYFAQFLPESKEEFDATSMTIPGWNQFLLNTYWTGADANTVGFACNPQAIAVGLGLPVVDPAAAGAGLMESLIQIPGLGASVAQYDWFSTKTRVRWVTWDIMIGAAAGDTTAGLLIKSA